MLYNLPRRVRRSGDWKVVLEEMTKTNILAKKQGA
jgi:hypothetical protein